MVGLRARERSEEKTVTHIAMTNDFLIYVTSRGFLHYFYLKQWADVNEFRHDNGAFPLTPRHPPSSFFINQTMQD